MSDDFDAIVEASLSDLKTPGVSDMLEEMSKGWNTAADVRSSIIDANQAWMELGADTANAVVARTRNLQLTFNRVTAALSFLAGLAVGIGGTGILISAVR